MPIRVLEPQVAAKIAAGEVVERPASVVKELVENALDAGATAIVVEVRRGGIEFIRVVDNGCGIPSSEVELAFQRHATSKLRTAQDLGNIATLGFRGEALPSIATVTYLSLLTRSGEESWGTFVELRQGAVVRHERRGAPPGTSVTVRGLFQRVPARLKFLKTPATEAGHIHALIAQFILAHSGVRFSLDTDGRRALAGPGSGDAREAAAAVYGAEAARSLLPVAHSPGDGRGLEVQGFIGPPSLTRGNRSAISIFVNGRSIQSRSLAYAVEEAYQGFLMERRHPLAILHLALPYEEVDVNVHPAKSEVRFRREREVFAAVQRSVREALVAEAPVPQIRPPGEARGPLAPPRPWRWPVEQALGLIPPAAPRAETPAGIQPRIALPALRVLGQVQSTYIVAEGPEGMYLIDQHAAHERVLFEKVRQEVAVGKVHSQALLEPVAVELAPHQQEALAANAEALGRFGFEVEPFGERVYLLRGVPSPLGNTDARQALLEVLEALADGTSPLAGDQRLAASVACHGAVRAGMALAPQEMEELVRSLERAREPHTCPHGRPTMIHLSASHLEREFGRR